MWATELKFIPVSIYYLFSAKSGKQREPCWSFEQHSKWAPSRLMLRLGRLSKPLIMYSVFSDLVIVDIGEQALPKAQSSLWEAVNHCRGKLNAPSVQLNEANCLPFRESKQEFFSSITEKQKADEAKILRRASELWREHNCAMSTVFGVTALRGYVGERQEVESVDAYAWATPIPKIGVNGFLTFQSWRVLVHKSFIERLTHLQRRKHGRLLSFQFFNGRRIFYPQEELGKV